ncbi:hypothetical protein [Granulosicoccus antarcticus]|uniref:Phytanoyl-CoA dioxygenase family protein n=1 Tax=Granulosicoccus antarcticus IMCC3135 TaxID=1192854 RepID=A0A2Z2NV31_9GAMM|nr:hypothetical protein [Granulosicoccus antarcticus]ASJ75103.1 hypothetical protein IMCC3135_25200 [Granulosicoccus antarcticus IMCC3135]
MTAILFDQPLDDDKRRERLYAGDILVYSANEHSMALVELAREMIHEAFPGGGDPALAQFEHSVEDYAQILMKLKPAFIHHPECKKIIPRLFESLGCDLDQMYFDVPRMRTSTSDDFLTSGIAFAFHPHRDTWYSAPMSQINWWLPIFDIEAGNAMAFHPKYFDAPVKNSSETYNYQEWNATSRFTVDQNVKTDTRPQPKAQEEVELEPSLVLVPPPGAMILFSAAHLHSSIPNSTGRTRFSIDFRVVHEGDLRAERGAENVDSRCTGSAIGDYLCASTLEHLPEDVQAAYLPGHPQSVKI